MSRRYIDSDEARFKKRESHLVDVEFFDGTTFEAVEPRRLFPLSGLNKYITLLDADGHEVAIIRNLDTLPEESRDIIRGCLEEYYMIPKITHVYECYEKHYVLHMNVDTDHGKRFIHIRNRYTDMKILYDGRVLIRDTDDNRYEIPDVQKLDRQSRICLSTEL